MALNNKVTTSHLLVFQIRSHGTQTGILVMDADRVDSLELS